MATQIKIVDAASGAGNEITTATLNNGQQLNLYAVALDHFGSYVGDATVNWNASLANGHLTNLTGSSTTFIPNGDQGNVVLSATHTHLGADTTGSIAVTYDVEDIAGLTLWLRADSFIGSLAPNDNVIIWQDVNGTGKFLNSLGPGQEPSYITNAINGHPAVRFNAIDSDGMQSGFNLASLITISEFTYFIVFNPTTISTDDADPINNNALIIDSNGNFGATLRSGAPLVQTYNFDGARTEVTKGISLAENYLFTSYHEAGNLHAQLNGDSVADVVSGNTDNLGGLLTVGGGLASAGFYDGDIAEIIIFNNSLSSADRLTVQNYLCAKYALPCP